MDISDIVSRVDHTLLGTTARWGDIKVLCDDAIHYGAATVCIPPCYVRQAREYVDGEILVCTVIGFPNGYNSTRAKVLETQCAVEDGADEIDMVINGGNLKDGRFDLILDEINAVKIACRGRVLKVIVETCQLDENEKVEICKVVSESDADYIKTSTGFGSAGATREDVALFNRVKDDSLKIKAAGGISSLKDAEDFIALGADRLGTSRIIKIIKKQDSAGSGY